MQPNTYSRFLPFEKYSVLTTLSEEEILERLQIITRTTDTIKFSAKTAVLLRSKYDYHGEIHEKSFEIWRNIYYRNSFRPIIYGTLSPYLDKTEIRISMNMHLFIKVILIILFSMALISSFISLEFSPLNFKTFIPLIVVLVGYIVVLFGFKVEARRSKKDLNKIFKAETNQSV